MFIYNYRFQISVYLILTPTCQARDASLNKQHWNQTPDVARSTGSGLQLTSTFFQASVFSEG